MRERAYFLSKLGKVQYLWCRSHSGTQVIGFEKTEAGIQISSFSNGPKDEALKYHPEHCAPIEDKEAQKIILAMVQCGLDMITN